MDILQLLKHSKTTDFSIRNLPFGIVKESGHYTVVSRLGDYVPCAKSYKRQIAVSPEIVYLVQELILDIGTCIIIEA